MLIAFGRPVPFLSRSDRKIPYGWIEKSRQCGRHREARKLASEVGKGFLQHIQSIVVVPGKSHCQTHCPVPMPVVDRLKRFRVSGVDGVPQLLIRSHVDRWWHSEGSLNDQISMTNDERCTVAEFAFGGKLLGKAGFKNSFWIL